MKLPKIKKFFGLVLTFVLAATFATASAPSVFAQSVGTASGTTAPNSALTSNTSENWAGYVSAENGAVYTAVSGSWNIPSPTISANTSVATDATWVGIGGVTGQDLIQAGTQAVVQNGAVTYEAWLETLPSFQQIIPLTVKGGDSVSVSLNQTSSGQWSLSFRDNTSGQNYSETIAYKSSLSSAEWIEEMPAGATSRNSLTFLPLDNFGTVNFTGGNAMVNGNTENIAVAGGQSLTMVDSGYALATPSALSTANGGSFSITRSAVTVSSSPSVSQQPTIQRQGRGFRRNGVGAQGFTRNSQAQTTGVNGQNTQTFSRRVSRFSFQNFRNQFNMRFLEN